VVLAWFDGFGPEKEPLLIYIKKVSRSSDFLHVEIHLCDAINAKSTTKTG
jgi:hypothetical protein